MMKSLIYTSSAVDAMTEKELSLIFEVSKSRNAKNGVTGMLIYLDGTFIQVLEGPAKSVDEIYASIKVDSRNKNIVLLNDEVIHKREFENWSMGYKNPHENILFKDFTSLLDLKKLFEHPGESTAKSILKSFYEVRMKE